MQSPETLLQNALRLLQAKSYVEAEHALQQILDQTADHPDALQLLGLALKNMGRLEEARNATMRSLVLNPEQTHVYNNLGGIHLRLDELTEARECFEEALKQDRGYKEAWRNLALTYRRLGRLEEAEQAARHAVSLDPNFAPGLAELGQILNEQNRSEDAVVFLQRATNLNPGVFQYWHNLGAALRASDQPKEAANALEMALKLAPRSAQSYALLGAIHQDQDNLEVAREAFRIATEVAPEHEEAHFALNQIHWMTGNTDAFLQSYKQAEAKLPASSNVRCAHAQTLLFLDRTDEAEQVLREAKAIAPGDVRVNHTLASVLSKRGQTDEALKLHEEAIRGAPSRPDLRTAFSRTLMRLGDFRAAVRQLEACDPTQAHDLELDQEIIALTHTCARHLGMPLAERLYDYRKMVRPLELPLPPGFRSIDAFNRALKDRLEELHTTRNEPIEQTLRGGTQTYGRLFSLDDPLVSALRDAIALAVETYMKDLPSLPDHPFETARPNVCNFAGSWSVRLRDQGFHKNHIHSRGWLSSAYYVSLPGEIGAKEGEKAGWLKFGQPNDLPGMDDPPEHWVRPEEGVLALFPSYMWHGTEPFVSEAPRITVAFDVQSNRPTKGQLGNF